MFDRCIEFQKYVDLILVVEVSSEVLVVVAGVMVVEGDDGGWER